MKEAVTYQITCSLPFYQHYENFTTLPLMLEGLGKP